MLPKTNRLPSSQIRLVMRSGKRIHQPALQLIYRSNNLQVSRFAVIVSTKVDKRAVMRNRIKRLLHQAVFNVLPNVTTGTDGILIAKNISLATDIHTTQTIIQHLFKEAHIL